MPIRNAEILDGHSRHQEVFEDAVLDYVHVLGGGAFVVIVIGAGEFHSSDLVTGRIVNHAEKFWQNLLADFLGEGLALFFVALAVAFEAVAEDFVEEYGRVAAAEQRGAVVRFRQRSEERRVGKECRSRWSP